MTIHIDSWQNVMVFFLTGSAFIAALSMLHWKLFLAPLFKKLIDPLSFRISVTSRVVQEKYPAEYGHAENIARADSRLWGKV